MTSICLRWASILLFAAALPAVEGWQAVAVPGHGLVELPAAWRRQPGAAADPAGLVLAAPGSRALLALAHAPDPGGDQAAWEAAALADLQRLGSALTVVDTRRLAAGSRTWLVARTTMAFARTPVAQTHWLGRVDGKAWSITLSGPDRTTLAPLESQVDGVAAGIGASAVRIDSGGGHLGR